MERTETHWGTYGNAQSDVQQRTGGKIGDELLERTETHWGTYGNAQSDVHQRTGGKHWKELLERTETRWRDVYHRSGGTNRNAPMERIGTHLAWEANWKALQIGKNFRDSTIDLAGISTI